MKIIHSIEGIRAVRSGYSPQSVGFVATMGYLHEGHLALVKQAKRDNERVIVSIFVNPKQFGPTEDLSRYPRDMERDFALLHTSGVDLVFVPDIETIYPADFQTVVEVSRITQTLEGAHRPTHFAGVTTVVAKLFNIVQPTRAYFGQKDAQQAAVIQQMVRDLNFNLEIVIGPTVREPDGLALSSRNKYLDTEQRAAATTLYRSLKAAEGLWESGVRDGNVLRQKMMDVLSAEPLARVDYVSAADPATLVEYGSTVPAGSGVLLSMAVFIGQTRLIDNFLLAVREGE
ncbi:MAG: pantoate--beta-alanine ligase [Candidatus Promineofilum sp.]|nr:pantoate--beta-alanine ligase [Promineifilum sp.]